MEDIDRYTVSYTPSHETYKYRLNKTIESLKLEHNKNRKLTIFKKIKIWIGTDINPKLSYLKYFVFNKNIKSAFRSYFLFLYKKSSVMRKFLYYFK